MKERVSGTKHLQFMCGLHYVTYWTANIVWDYLIYLIPCVSCIITALAFSKSGFTGIQEQVAPLILITESLIINELYWLTGMNVMCIRAPWYWLSSVTDAQRFRRCTCCPSSSGGPHPHFLTRLPSISSLVPYFYFLFFLSHFQPQ